MKEIEINTTLDDKVISMAENIVTRLCKRAMRTMNEVGKDIVLTTDEYPKSFTFIDRLSIELQDRTYDEIDPIALEDYVMSTLDDEWKHLPAKETVVLRQAYPDLDDDDDEITRQIRDCFHKMLDEHYELKKIQNFIDKRW